MDNEKNRVLGGDKAYLFGLIIGGGSFGSSKSSFVINLPYDDWGNVSKNPVRSSEIISDIVNGFGPVIQNVYGLNITPHMSPKQWQITINGDYSNLKEDLCYYGVSLCIDMRKSASISKLCSALATDFLKKRFILGLADTIGSTNPNHRRFNDNVQIVSFEFSGFNYDLVFNICKLFAAVGCFADQVLWNHPNLHSTLDPYYDKWKKGFKLRVPMDFYTDKLGFTFRSKTMSAKNNLTKEKKGKVSSVNCANKPLSIGCSTIHPAESDSLLPQIIRGGHYIHHKQICAVLGCPYAPYNEIEKRLEEAEKYISPFPILHKGEKFEISNLIKGDDFLSQLTFSKFQVSVKTLLDLKRNGDEFLLYGSSSVSGYPLGRLLDAANYLFQKSEGKLKGLRTQGNRDEFLQDYISLHPNAAIEILKPNLISTLVIQSINDNGAVMVGAKNPTIYKKLIHRDPNNKYKLLVRQIKKEDFD